MSQLEIPSLVDSTAANVGYASPSTYNLTSNGLELVASLVTPGDWSQVPSLVAFVQLIDANNYWVGFLAQAGEMQAVYSEPGASNTVIGSATIDPNLGTELSLHLEEGEALWRTVAGGAVLLEAKTEGVLSGIDLTALTLKVGNYTTASESTSTQTTFNKLRLHQDVLNIV